MRRTAQNVILTPVQKQGISSYCYKFIDSVINNTKKKEEILPNLIDYFKNDSLGEFSLKQTIAKGFFPRFTLKKQDALSFINTSGKLKSVNPLEKTDVRFLPEAIVANQFADQQSNVQQILFNNEKPSEIIAKSSYGGGNYVKDIALVVKPLMNNFELDIKCGNNAYTSTYFILGPLVFLPDGTSYSVLCDHPKYDKIEEQRLKFFRNLNSNNHLSNETLNVLESIIKMPFDNLNKNIITQDTILKLISTGIIKCPPSFYAGFKVDKHQVDVSYYEKLEPYINSNNFNSKRDFAILGGHAIKAYCETNKNTDKSKIFNNKLFEEAGFNAIDVENLFK